MATDQQDLERRLAESEARQAQMAKDLKYLADLKKPWAIKDSLKRIGFAAMVATVLIVLFMLWVRSRTG